MSYLEDPPFAEDELRKRPLGNSSKRKANFHVSDIADQPNLSRVQSSNSPGLKLQKRWNQIGGQKYKNIQQAGFPDDHPL
jgi:hypothetical protein